METLGKKCCNFDARRLMGERRNVIVVTVYIAISQLLADTAGRVANRFFSIQQLNIV